MIGKFVTASVLPLLVLTILLGRPGFAQTTPAAQTPTAAPAEQTPTTQAPATSAPATSTPAAPTSSAPAPTAQKPDSGQEPAEEISSSRKVRPHDYKNWNFDASVGANMDSGKTKEFVRGGGVAATAGVARNANKYLGLRADFIWANLPLRQSTLGTAQASGASSNLFAVTLDPIINIPVTSLYSGYVLLGPSFYHRMGHLSGDTTVPGSSCDPFWNWWGACATSNASIPLSGSFVTSSQNQFGYNAGAGVARKFPSGVEFFAEYRLLHGAHNGITTDVRPITIGLRW